MSFYSDLSAATNEDKQVNPIYINAIAKTLPKLGGGLDKQSASYDLYTDGVFECWYVSDTNSTTKEYFLLQLECKLDIDLHNPAELAKVILQVCFYLKQFERNNMQIPKVLVVGTKLNCFAAPAYFLYKKYIENTSYPIEDEYGHKISASTAPNHHLYQPRLKQIENDAEFSSLIRITDASDKNAIQELCIDILKVAKEIGLKEDVTAENLARAYDFFELKVVDQKQKDSLTTRELVGAFMQLMLNPGNVTAEQTRNALGQIIGSGAMNFNGRIIQVNPDAFNSFANVFAVKTYDIKDQKALTEIQDRLIEDTDRRRKGDYYTPTIWVNEAHKLMDKHLGPDWREKYIVWDCAWGTGNLTRDYAFADLYCSTLIQEDLDTAARYNPLACKFQYDFLNDDVLEFEQIPHILFRPFFGKYTMKQLEKYINFRYIDKLYSDAVERGIVSQEACTSAYTSAADIIRSTKLYQCAPGLIDGLLGINGKEKKDLVFLINPPYKGAGSGHGKENSIGVVDTFISQSMKDNGVQGTGQLYAQFVYRILRINLIFGTGTVLGIFSPTQILNSVQFAAIRAELFKHSGYFNGFMLQASNFADVAPGWAISFTLWGGGVKKATTVDVKELEGGKISTIQENKLISMLDRSRKGLYWIKESSKIKTNIIPRFTSAINYDTSKYYEQRIDALATVIMDMGIVESNLQRVAIMPSRSNANWSIIDITPSNFDKVVSYFTARKLITPTWVNWQDEYMVPNTEHPDYAQWQSDCIVYSLFNSKSQQSSLRSIYYRGKDWDIYNEFFWLSRNRMLQLAEQHNNMAVYDDVINHGKSERFVYEKLKKVTLSEDAKLVLELATKIVEKTFQYRQQFAEKHQEYHINTWDAGWYQIKAIAKEYCKEDLEYFNEMYKKLSDRMRPLVYELGFLYK